MGVFLNFKLVSCLEKGEEMRLDESCIKKLYLLEVVYWYVREKEIDFVLWMI